ncbi:hypothetical protein CLTEP_24780 [Clostridium tepidiprofundi DSM 19306]|uniref:Uncharacterized protein n=1 Tax=Clostridium tepidiprofundi DSM 19306 TaxID=1121338 RepID=A0A151ATH8_9CLOT|nr:hypothetical protein [Clostridium tepidiprofundi]KYH30892.1 hypothetical protein CLTEP_24780 [Clostridium tepidiprofundi DSM 19306]
MSSKDLLWKIKKSTQNGVDIITKKSENLMNYLKIQSEIHSCEEKIDNLFIEIGKLVYEKYKYNKNIDSSYKDYCKTINKLEKKIKSINKE